ncbi:hypothetical protein B0H66DRAFT_576715 [Apodospora peruviana]|uniref:AA1-like domain-containing protein n=1 Tax=Apodospora peruviana TaxID=516989 RepID=A0AAE0M0K0_9PEZI|nr:hypothetical protein B0H66DRAFT_576715 [Apodospora peruviana]
MRQLLTTLLLLLIPLPSQATPIYPRTNTPSCPARPPRDGKCWKDVLGLEWSVKNFDYHASYTFTTPAHQNSFGYVNFNLTNNLKPDIKAVCSAASSQLTDFYYGSMPYSCELTATGKDPVPAGTAVTWTFNRPTGELAIDETVVCQEGKATGMFYASGAKNLTLSCTDTTWTNPNWTMGAIYSDRTIKCKPVDLKIHVGKIIAEV